MLDFQNPAMNTSLSALSEARRLIQAAEFSEALTLIDAILEEHPAHMHALLNAADCCIYMKHFDDAAIYMEKAQAVDENNPDLLLVRARMLMQQGFLGKAANAAEGVLQVQPKRVEALMIKGQCLITSAQIGHQTEHAVASISCFDAILDQIPTHMGALMQSAIAYEMVGDIRQAEKRFVNVCELAHGWAYTYRELTDFYIRHHQFAKALDALEICLERDDGNDLGAAAKRVFLLERLNRLDEAKAWALALLERGISTLTLYPHLARVERRLGDIEASRGYYQHILDNISATDEHKAAAYFELGRIADKQGDYAEAARLFTLANEHFLRTPAAEQQNGERVYADISARQAWLESQNDSVFAGWAKALENAEIKAPVFLMGFMRSGTTLMEQVLLAHPKVASLQEYPVLTEIIAGMPAILGRQLTYPDVLTTLDEHDIGLLREAYWQLAMQHTFNDSVMDYPVIVDKMPFNLMHAELIARIFPESPIVVMERDSRDVMLSCFMQDFGANPATVELTSKASITRLYDAMMGYWECCKSRMTFNLLSVEYERFVSDFEAEARQVLTHVGLPWNDRILQFHTKVAKRSVTTPSYENVTEPVYTRSIGRWQHYDGMW